MKKLINLLPFLFLVACNSTPSWDSYTYNGEIINVQDGNVVRGEAPTDWNKMELVIETNCSIAEAVAHERHASKKFAEFQKKVEKIRPTKTDFCVGGPTTPIEFHFIKKELNSIPLDWGIEMTEFSFVEKQVSAKIKNQDAVPGTLLVKKSIKTIGYILRKEGELAVMYEVGDSSTQYYGYNNVLYTEMMKHLNQ